MDSPPARQRRIFDSRPDGYASGGGVVRASLPVLGNRVMTPAEAFFCRCSALPCEQKFIAGPHKISVRREERSIGRKNPQLGSSPYCQEPAERREQPRRRTRSRQAASQKCDVVSRAGNPCFLMFLKESMCFAPGPTPAGA